MSNNTHKEPEQLEREVREARDQLSSTVDEISGRLSPGELLDQALDVTKGYGGDFAKNLGQQAKDNPLALMVTGVGMAWMMLGNQQQSAVNTPAGFSSSDSQDSPLGTSPGIGGVNRTASEYASGNMGADVDKDSDTVSNLAQQIPDSERVKEYAKSAQTQLQRTLEDQPVMAGALGVALGAALGALLPPSEAEDRLMGEDSDRLADKATQIATEKYQDTKETLEQKVSAVDNHNTYSSQTTHNIETDNS